MSSCRVHLSLHTAHQDYQLEPLALVEEGVILEGGEKYKKQFNSFTVLPQERIFALDKEPKWRRWQSNPAPGRAKEGIAQEEFGRDLTWFQRLGPCSGKTHVTWGWHLEVVHAPSYSRRGNPSCNAYLSWEAISAWAQIYRCFYHRGSEQGFPETHLGVRLVSSGLDQSPKL